MSNYFEHGKILVPFDSVSFINTTKHRQNDYGGTYVRPLISMKCGGTFQFDEHSTHHNEFLKQYKEWLDD